MIKEFDAVKELRRLEDNQTRLQKKLWKLEKDLDAMGEDVWDLKINKKEVKP